MVCVWKVRGRIPRSGQWIAREFGSVSVYCDRVGCHFLCLRYGIPVWLHIGQSTTATSRHCCDITSDVKATLNPYKQTYKQTYNFFKVFTNCSCTPDGVAVDGACEVGCDVSLIIYSVITFFVVVLGAMATTPCTVITMRCVLHHLCVFHNFTHQVVFS